MNELKIFENPEFGKVRTFQLNNEIYFVGKDVAEALEYSNASKAVSKHVNEEDRMLKTLEAPSQNGNVVKTQTTLINESGLYSLIFGSKLESAKRFKHWVTSEVLPSIRKNCGYIAGQETLSDDELLAKALMVAQNKIAERDKQIERMRPKEIFADAVSSSKTDILVGDLAKILKGNGVDIGQNKLFAWMRENGYLIKKAGESYNMPTQKAMELKLFRVKESTVMNPDGSVRVTCIYRPVRAQCAEFQCTLSASSVHAFQKANHTFDLLNYPNSYLRICVNGAFMPPKAMPLT